MPGNPFAPIPAASIPYEPPAQPSNDAQHAFPDNQNPIGGLLNQVGTSLSSAANANQNSDGLHSDLLSSIADPSNEYGKLNDDLNSVDFTPEISAAQAADKFLAAGQNDAGNLAQPFDWTSGLETPSPAISSPPTGGAGIASDLGKFETVAIKDIKSLGKWLATVAVDIGKAVEAVVEAVTKILAAIPIWGWIIAGVIAVVALLFHGADPNQVPASKIQQIFDAAHQDFRRLQEKFYLTQAETIAALTKLLATATALFQNLPNTLPAAQKDPRPFNNGLKEIQNTIQQAIVNAKAFSDHAAIPWDETTATQLYIQPGTPGWYAESPGQAIELVNGYMDGLRNTSPLASTGTAPTLNVTPDTNLPSDVQQQIAASVAAAKGQTT